MRVYVTGAGGQLGGALAATAPPGAELAGLTSVDLDITDAVAVHAWANCLMPSDVLINCAAYTRVDDAETDVTRAAAVNSDGPANLAAQTAAVGARLIHLSLSLIHISEPTRPY